MWVPLKRRQIAPCSSAGRRTSLVSTERVRVAKIAGDDVDIFPIRADDRSSRLLKARDFRGLLDYPCKVPV